jgi:hypothetical protein
MHGLLKATGCVILLGAVQAVCTDHGSLSYVITSPTRLHHTPGFGGVVCMCLCVFWGGGGPADMFAHNKKGTAYQDRSRLANSISPL